MAERVLANPLSGSEVMEAVLDKIRTKLQSDCYLSPNVAYDYFTCNVKLSLRAHDVGRTAEVEVDETITAGESNPEHAALEAADAEFQIEAAPPNEVRVETGQPVPVLTRDSDGKPEVKHIKYSRKQLEKAAR
jgi:hypothetical protein